MNLRCSLIFLFLAVSMEKCNCVDLFKEQYQWPTIGISILVRNKEASLPYFLTCLQKLDYPKDRLYIWIYSDFNEDSSIQILQEWSENHSSKYRKFHMTLDHNSDGKKLVDQTHYSEWSPLRYRHIIELREKALKLAKDSWADYVFMLDADVFLTNPGTLKLLVEKDRHVVAPMLLTDGLYSNFWAGMTPDYYYQRTQNYEDIIRRKEVGCFVVPMVHSAVLISLRQGNTDLLTYDPKKMTQYNGPHDDIITFALSARQHSIDLTVCNDEIYGFLPIPVEDEFNSETEQVDNLKLEALGRGIDLPIDPSMVKYMKLPKKTKYNLDEIFLINLEKRTERKKLMIKSFDTLGMDVKVIKAVDGKKLTANDLRELSVTLLPNYEDPYHKRPMKAGEIGCFLSHFNVWTEIAKRNLRRSLILEDDIHFVPYFHERFNILMAELENLNWDFVYIGRKVLQNRKESFAENHIVKPLYSYWTLGYLLSESGARKLINAEPLAKMLPVDEFLPIMFDQHPNGTWKSMFPNRDLLAYSASPLLVHPTHYTGEPGYISDTEDSPIAERPKTNTPKIGEKKNSLADGLPERNVPETGNTKDSFIDGLPERNVPETGDTKDSLTDGLPETNVPETGDTKDSFIDGLPERNVPETGDTKDSLTDGLPETNVPETGDTKDSFIDGLPETNVPETGDTKDSFIDGLPERNVPETGDIKDSFIDGLPEKNVPETGDIKDSFTDGLPETNVPETGDTEDSFIDGLPEKNVPETGDIKDSFTDGLPERNVPETGDTKDSFIDGLPETNTPKIDDTEGSTKAKQPEMSESAREYLNEL